MEKKISTLRIVISGLIMGMAEVVPGVSGGTVAFVAGIYERLLNSIASLRLIPKWILAGQWQDLWDGLDVPFLLKLGAGMVVGIILGVAGITYLLEYYPPVIWGLFFGLVLASIPYIAVQMNWSHTGPWLTFILGVAVALAIGLFQVGTGNEALWFVFLCGAVAIVALVLPGISGSFILLLLGMYTYIVRDTLKGLAVDFSSDKLVTMLAFAMGCVLGLLTIARVLKWAFNHYRDMTMGLLVGFMAGALPKLWPWRNATTWLEKETGMILNEPPVGEFKILSEVGVWPSGYVGDALALPTVLAILFGLALIFMLYRFERD